MEFGLFGTKANCPQKRGVCIIEVEFVWNLVSFGPRRTVRNREVSVL